MLIKNSNRQNKKFRNFSVPYFILFIFPLLLILFFFTNCTTNANENIQFTNDSSLFESFMLVVNEEMLSFSLIGNSEFGLKALRILCQDIVLTSVDCQGQKICKLSGNTKLKNLRSDIITGEIVSNTTSQKEKMKINFNIRGDRVYLIASLPDYLRTKIVEEQPQPITMQQMQIKNFTDQPDPDQPLQASQATQTQSTGTTLTRQQITGPLITIESQNIADSHKIKINATDSRGIDFIELLEENVFYDVQLCKGANECIFEININNAKMKANYTIKAMNKEGGLTVIEKKFDELK